MKKEEQVSQLKRIIVSMVDAEEANFIFCLFDFFQRRPCCQWISRQHRANRQVYKRLVSLRFSLIPLRIPPADNLLKRINMKIYVSFLFSQIHFSFQLQLINFKYFSLDSSTDSRSPFGCGLLCRRSEPKWMELQSFPLLPIFRSAATGTGNR